MNILLQQLTEEVNARGYSEKTLTSYLAANDHLIRYFDPPIDTIGVCALFNDGDGVFELARMAVSP
jgi:hypothetical protein